MALYLVQHGKSLPKEDDPGQGLCPEGFADVRRMAAVAQTYGVRPSQISHSGKKRAQQTAEIFAEALLGDKSQTGSTPGLAPSDDVLAVATGIKSGDNIMLVGHLPFLERLVGQLVAGSTDRVVFKFQNGGIVCLDKNQDSGLWFIRWTLMPRID